MFLEDFPHVRMCVCVLGVKEVEEEGNKCYMVDLA